MNPFGHDDVAGVQRYPGERCERQVPLDTGRGGEVPVEEPDKLTLVVPGRVVRGGVVLTDHQARLPAPALAPHRVARGHEARHGGVVAPEPAGYLGKGVVGMDPGGPGSAVADGVAG